MRETAKRHRLFHKIGCYGSSSWASSLLHSPQTILTQNTYLGGATRSQGSTLDCFIWSLVRAYVWGTGQNHKIFSTANMFFYNGEQCRSCRVVCRLVSVWF